MGATGRFCVLALLVCGFSAGGCREGNDDQEFAADPQLRSLYERAKDGEAQAQYGLARHYLDDGGLGGNESLGVEWLQRAAEQGLPAAQVELAFGYLRGTGPLGRDDDEAARLAGLAAREGNPRAQGLLAFMYFTGMGVGTDYAEAARWAALAAEQGNLVAQEQLGKHYYYGQGVPQDYSLAAKWLGAAAQRGSPEAQHMLGLMYRDGDGFRRDALLAYVWLNLAASNASADMQKYYADVRDRAGRRLRTELREEGQRLASQWQKRSWDDLKNQDNFTTLSPERN